VSQLINQFFFERERLSAACIMHSFEYVCIRISCKIYVHYTRVHLGTVRRTARRARKREREREEDNYTRETDRE
jgi:hypothetical protein